uniref:TAR DNA-binding protein 43 N-terminal domain-containing protein n=1 Tax=Panagrolaimus sp. JU765 TaxID=591449 RepID=A0AC34QXD9_9BILA
MEQLPAQKSAKFGPGLESSTKMDKVVVVEDRKKQVKKRLPLDPDDTLAVATLSSAFGGALGLEFETSEGMLQTCRLDPEGKKLFAPAAGWTGQTFFAIFSDVPQLPVSRKFGADISNSPETGRVEAATLPRPISPDWDKSVMHYLLETDAGCCVTVMARRAAVTCWHCISDELTVGDFVNVKPARGNPSAKFPNKERSAVLKIVLIDERTDFVLLLSAIDLCIDPPFSEDASFGLPYIMLGLSGLEREFTEIIGLKTTVVNAPLVIKRGVVSSKRRDKFNRHLGDAGMNPGDSGAGLYGLDGAFLGIAVCFDTESDKGISLCHFAPATFLEIRIQDLGYSMAQLNSSNYQGYPEKEK